MAATLDRRPRPASETSRSGRALGLLEARPGQTAREAGGRERAPNAQEAAWEGGAAPRSRRERQAPPPAGRAPLVFQRPENWVFGVRTGKGSRQTSLPSPRHLPHVEGKCWEDGNNCQLLLRAHNESDYAKCFTCLALPRLVLVSYEEVTVIPILQRGKLRRKEANWLIQGQ